MAGKHERSVSTQQRTDQRTNQRTKRSPFEIAAVVAFLAVNVIAPFAFGEFYPFTISPMFCDEPSEYCEYEVFSADGASLPLDEFALQRNYDGNPPGMGVGIRPAMTLDQFGTVPSPEQIRNHVRPFLLERPDLESVRIVQRVFGAVDNQHVGILEDRTVEILVIQEAGQP